MEPQIFVLKVIFDGPFAGIGFGLNFVLRIWIVEVASDNLLIEMTVSIRVFLWLMTDLLTLSSASAFGGDFIILFSKDSRNTISTLAYFLGGLLGDRCLEKVRQSPMHFGCFKAYDIRARYAIQLMLIPFLWLILLPPVDSAHPIFIGSQLLLQVNIHKGVLVVQVQILTPVFPIVVNAVWVSHVSFVFEQIVLAFTPSQIYIGLRIAAVIAHVSDG